jgi:peptidoglycan-associated lipoprotein
MSKVMEISTIIRSRGVLVAAVAAVAISAGCAKKKVAAVTPPAPPAAVERPAAPQAAPPQQAAATPAPVRATERPRTPDAATRKRIEELIARIEDAYFDYDKATLRADAIEALRKDSNELRDILKDYPDYKLTIEGHADERGSAEYNMALGQARADAAKAYLVQVGIPSQQLNVITYGKQKPACQESNENCWQKNRRIHIVAGATSE